MKKYKKYLVIFLIAVPAIYYIVGNAFLMSLNIINGQDKFETFTNREHMLRLADEENFWFHDVVKINLVIYDLMHKNNKPKEIITGSDAIEENATEANTTAYEEDTASTLVNEYTSLNYKDAIRGRIPVGTQVVIRGTFNQYADRDGMMLLTKAGDILLIFNKNKPQHISVLDKPIYIVYGRYDGLDQFVTNGGVDLTTPKVIVDYYERGGKNYSAKNKQNITHPTESQKHDLYLKSPAAELLGTNSNDVIVKQNSKGVIIYCTSDMSLCKTEQEVLEYRGE